MLPDLEIRFFPRRLVEIAKVAGWQVHPDADPDDWAVLMRLPEPVPVPALRTADMNINADCA